MRDPAMMMYTSGHDVAPEGLPDLARVARAHRPHLRRAALPDASRRPHVGPAADLPPGVDPAVQRLPGHRCDLRRARALRARRGAEDARAMHGRLRRLRPDLGGGARPPRLRRHRPLGAAAGQRQRRARAADADGRAGAVADADLALRRHRGRRRARAQPSRRPAGAPRRVGRAAVRRHGGPDRRPGDGRSAAARRAWRDHLPRPRAVRRLLQGSRADRGGRSTPTASSTPATSASSTPTAA